MAQCPQCSVELAVHLRRCPDCGADIERRVRTDVERSQARICHLIAAPGMLIFCTAMPMLGPLAFAPWNLIALFVYRRMRRDSPTVQTHSGEALNFQIPWSAAMLVLWLLLMVFAAPRGADPWWAAAGNWGAFGQPVGLTDWPTTQLEQPIEGDAEDEDEDVQPSFWALSTIAFWGVAVAWLGGIGLALFMAYDLGNGGRGRYPLRANFYRSE